MTQRPPPRCCRALAPLRSHTDRTAHELLLEAAADKASAADLTVCTMATVASETQPAIAPDPTALLRFLCCEAAAISTVVARHALTSLPCP